MFHYRGIIEGFYGQPWSHQERLQILKWMANHGYTDYIYAPKKDSYHRANWRQPYPSKEREKFAQLIEVAKQQGVNFYMAISPGLSLEYSSAHDRQILSEKLESFLEMGVKGFGIFFDDIPLKLHHPKDLAQFKNLATAQIDLVNQLFTKLQNKSEVELIFCPTIYWGQGDEEYLKILGQGLAPQIQVFWTGSEICSTKITAEDLKAVTQALQRNVIIWDNYPVNDAMMTPELHLGPYVGRGADLIDEVKGFFINPMNQLTASLITLHAIGHYLDNPQKYDAEISLSRGIEQVVGEDLLEAFSHFVQYNLVSPIHRSELNSLEPIWQKAEFAELKTESYKMLETATKLLKDLKQTDLGQEIQPWLIDFMFYGKLGQKIAEVEQNLRSLFNLQERKKILRAFFTLQINLNRLQKLLQRVPQLRTAVTGDLIYQRGLRVYRSIEGLIRIYIADQGLVFRFFRCLLKKF